MEEVSKCRITAHRWANRIKVIARKTIDGVCAVYPVASSAGKEDEDRAGKNREQKFSAGHGIWLVIKHLMIGLVV